MNAEQFAYWLQGFAELAQGVPPTPEQWKSINDHLQTVFVKVTPTVVLPEVQGCQRVKRAEGYDDRIARLMSGGEAGLGPLITC